LAASLAFAGTLAVSSAAIAQGFPNRQVTLVIPFGPGGSNDTYGRVLADKLGKLWKQTIVVENKPGAGSAIGSAHVAQSKPDGHTLLFISTSYTTSAATQAKLPYDPLKDLAPIGVFANADLFLMTGKRVPMSSLQDLQREAKVHKIFAGAPGVGSISHLAQLLLNEKLGITTDIVQHTSGGNVMTDLGGGRIDTYFGVVFEASNPAVTPIVVMSKERSAALPNVPTIVEAGYPDAITPLWFGVFAAAGTPKDIITKVNSDIIKVMKDPASAEFLKAQGLTVSEIGPDEFSKMVESDIKRWTALAEKNGLRK